VEFESVFMEALEESVPLIQDSTPKSSISIPISGYDILEFLDWDDRFRLQDCVRRLTVGIFGLNLAESWMYSRLLQESYIVKVSTDMNMRYYLSMRRSITDSDSSWLHGRACIRTSFIATNTAIESMSTSSNITGMTSPPRIVSEDSSDYYTDDGCDKSPKGNRSMRLRFRLSRSLSHKSSSARIYQLVYSPVAQTVSGLIESSESTRIFRTNEFLPSIKNLANSECVTSFVNGRSYCVFLNGHESCLVETMGELVNEWVRIASPPIHLRSEALCEKLKTIFTYSLVRLFRSRMDIVWSGVVQGSGVIPFEMLRGLNGHLAFEMKMEFQFCSPLPGNHTCRFVVCIPSQPERARRGASLDLLALKNCLRAIKSDNSFIPSRDSLLTHWLDLKNFDNVYLVTAVNDSTDRSRHESVSGLKFGEQFY